MMEISKQAVSELLKRLKDGREILNEKIPRSTLKKTLSYDENMAYDVVRQF